MNDGGGGGGGGGGAVAWLLYGWFAVDRGEAGWRWGAASIACFFFRVPSAVTTTSSSWTPARSFTTRGVPLQTVTSADSKPV